MGLLISKTDVEQLVSDLGVDNLTDDGVEDTLVDQSIEFAEAKIIGVLGFKYSVSILAQAPVIKQIAVYMASNFLSERRGNPGYYEEQMRKAEEELADLRNGDFELVDSSGNLLAQDNLPHFPISMQNLVVDESHPNNRIRTRPESSFQTGDTNTYSSLSFNGLFGR